MNALIEFLKTNYIYFVFIGIILILALIGYIVESSKREKNNTKPNENKEEEFVLNIPEMENVKIGETVNKNAGVKLASEIKPPEINPTKEQ